METVKVAQAPLSFVLFFIISGSLFADIESKFSIIHLFCCSLLIRRGSRLCSKLVEIRELLLEMKIIFRKIIQRVWKPGDEGGGGCVL